MSPWFKASPPVPDASPGPPIPADPAPETATLRGVAAVERATGEKPRRTFEEILAGMAAVAPLTPPKCPICQTEYREEKGGWAPQCGPAEHAMASQVAQPQEDELKPPQRVGMDADQINDFVTGMRRAAATPASPVRQIQRAVQPDFDERYP